jgi:5-hydroxyisourate hydrolase-like protein (transthyretin family)
MPATNKQQQINTVFGKVTDGSGRPLANLKVEIYNVDLRAWHPLADTHTNRDGSYELRWTQDQLKGREKKTADIALRVSTSEKNTELFRSSMDEVRFNASEREEINVTIRQNLPQELIEFDFLVKEVSFLAGRVAMADLQENQEHRDVTFLSKELEVPAERIEYLVVAHRMQNLSKIDPAFFYALFRKNTLLHNNSPGNLNARMAVGMGTDDQTLLYHAAMVDPDKIEADIQAAAGEMIVAPGEVKNIRHNLKILSQYRKKAEEYYKNEHPGKAFQYIGQFFREGKLTQIQSLFEENKNDLKSFFDKVTDPSFFETTDKEKDTGDNDPGRLLGFGNAIIPKIAKARGIKKPEDAGKLARLNKAAWVEEISKTRPAIKDKLLISQYASAIVRKMEHEFPTVAFAAQLERTEKPVLKNQDQIVSFFNRHEDFDMLKHNVDLYLKEKKVPEKDAKAVGEELKSVQRVFKLAPNYSKTVGLLNENINSSQNIVALGETRFVHEVAPKAGIEAKEAHEIYRKAEARHTAAMLMVGDLQDSMSVMEIASFETTSLAEKLEAVSKDFPNLKSLFKLVDTCECKHCRSVYSPAAYLVEILQFLEKRMVVANNAKSILLLRRPELGDIDLGCANANTPVKYIDLVCEILEEAIAPDEGIDFNGTLFTQPTPDERVVTDALRDALTAEGLPVTPKAKIFGTETLSGISSPWYLRDDKAVCKIMDLGGNNYKIYRLRQTHSTAAELDAAPEYVNQAAYHELKNKAFAFKLPFDLHHTEAKGYFSRFDVSRAGLMKAFQSAGTPSDVNIAAERLGLTEPERKLIAEAPAPNDNAAQQEVWNVPAPGNVTDHLKQVDHFLDKTNLTFRELDLLLKLKFIDPDDNLFIRHLDLSCDTEKKEIVNLDLDALDRIHRFLRLQKKTGWNFEVLDEIISQTKLGAGKLDDACLVKAAQLKEISEKTKLKIEELTGFFGSIPYLVLHEEGPKPLFQQIFVNKAVNGAVNEKLSVENILDNESGINDPTTKPAGWTPLKLEEIKQAIAAGLQLKGKDLEYLIRLPHQLANGSLAYTALLTDDNLTFSNLSHLYAASRLLKKLKLKAEDFAILQKLSGIDISSGPDKALEFIELAGDFKNSPLKAADTRFILNHEAANLNDRVIKDEKIEELLGKLKSGYEKINEEQKSKFDDSLSAEEQQETLSDVLSGVKGKEDDEGNIQEITEDVVKTILKMLSRDWTDVTDATGAKTFIDDTFVENIRRTDINAAIDALDAVTDAAKDQAVEDHEIAQESLRTAQHAVRDAQSPADLAAANAAVAAAEAQILATFPPYNLVKGRNLLKAFLDSISVWQVRTQKHLLLEQTLATGFKADPALVETVLKHAKLKQTAPGTDLLADLLSDDFDNDITPANYPKQYAAIKLLHKMFALLNALQLNTNALEWHLKRNADPALDWFEPDGIPYEAGQTPVPVSDWLEFLKFISLTKRFTPVTNPLDAEQPVSFYSIAEMILSGAATDRDEFLYRLALLTGYGKDDLDAIDAHLFAAFDVGHYKHIRNWERLFECAEFTRKLGADVDQVKTYIKPELASSEVSDLRATLKARYDEDTWLDTLKEIMDTIRPQKRDALVAYLLATHPDIKDSNDLYEYFLVDVEMEACMPSSRIVQAHNSIQLFVQRCLMGLEPDAIANVDKDPGWNQWKWMKNYRVWEANRKVFLYPENWYDVTLTDDKTWMLTEFINEIQQNELTNDTAEEALKKYLEKLDNIAFLEVMATWYDVPNRNMHVFARTKGGDPAIYYYRRFEKERYWSPWEKVELDITGDHLMAFRRNNRLHLAWPVFSEVAEKLSMIKIPSTSPGTDVQAEPRKQLKIQLAVSEYTNKKWQPKRVSKEAIFTPGYFSDNEDDFRRDVYNLKYFAWPKIKNFPISEVVCLFKEENERQLLCGTFNIAGCKGYPELLNLSGILGERKIQLDFLPDFKDTALLNQRYIEQNLIQFDELEAKNGISIFRTFDYLKILNTTPGKFKVSWPHQFTAIDLISLLLQFLFTRINGSSALYDRRLQLKIPQGTLLPWFKEDSSHAYVVIPGFYKKVMDGDEFADTYTLNDAEKRTASNAFQLLDDIIRWHADLVASGQTLSTSSLPAILTDPEFQSILKELSRYADFDFFLNLLVGVSGDPQVDEFLEGLISEEPLKYGEQFKNFYHPRVCDLRSILYRDGIPALMKRDTQLQKTDFNFKSYYNPDPQVVPKTLIKNHDGTGTWSFPIEDVDFSSDGSYSAYNWDLFFRVPLHIAASLTRNQRFEEALSWFHYMFNPTGALPGNGVQKYWVTKPFYLNQETDYITQRIDALMYETANLSNPNIRELEFAVDEWRNKPFRPDVIARFRPVAYQKALLMKYIDNLTEWGDYLFRQDTMESVAQATQMYILADKLLGPKPRIVPAAVSQPNETYNQIEARLDHFGNALVELENILPDLSVLPEGGAELPAPPVTLSMLYFCIPANEKMFEYWDRVADRLFKIRHCQNIEGVERSLALFAPPIDPGMLVRAAASGLDLSSVIAGLNAPTPYYRFNVLSQKATELAQEVRGLGNSLLQALEKKDAEELSLLRNELEIKVLNAVKDIKKLQINEAKEQIEILNRTKKVTEERQKYYATIEKIISKEQLSLDKLSESHNFQIAAQTVKLAASLIALIPDLDIGASGWAASPVAKIRFGGLNLSQATNAASDILSFLSMLASNESARASVLGGYDRRFDDWKLQELLATKELVSIDKQITAAEIRREIAETDLKNHEMQIENANKTDEFMRSKYTNRELYDWMAGQISAVYFRSYQLAHDFAKKAERCYRFELGSDDSFITYGYWDSMKKGLQSADHLIHDIKRMETGYIDKNKREYEITKHVSLAQLDPLALIRLRSTGICDFEVPEALYDMDHPGHYFRRLKSASISLPCIAGPYTSVSARLSLVNNRYRKNGNDPSNYAEDIGTGDNRFVYNVGSIQSIATSNAQNDSGVFELNFRDERYLPFENTGAISSWRLELPTEVRQFDYNTISDVILHIRYTAREGGSVLKNAANASLRDQLDAIRQGLKQTGLHTAINLKHDLPNEWHLLTTNGTVDLTLHKSGLPYMVQGFDTTVIESVMFIAKVKGNPAEFPLNVDGADTKLAWLGELKLNKGVHTATDLVLDTTFPLAVSPADKDKLEELLVVVKYSF